MRALTGLAVFLIPLSFSSATMGGAISGGGGKGVVCRDSTGAIQSAELLDLYEGRTQYGYEIRESSLPKETQLEEVISRMGEGRGPEFVQAFRGMTALVVHGMRLLPDGTGLVPVDDSYEVILPKDCQVQQLANFLDDKNQVLVDGEIWSKLSETHKAALILHEALYKYLRLFGESNSVATRHAVALGFAGGNFEPYKAGLPGDAWSCYAQGDANESAIFWAYNDANGDLVFQFDFLSGTPVLSRASASFSGIPVTRTDKFAGVPMWTFLTSALGERAFGVRFSTAPGETQAMEGEMGLVSPMNPPTVKFACRPDSVE